MDGGRSAPQHGGCHHCVAATAGLHSACAAASGCMNRIAAAGQSPRNSKLEISSLEFRCLTAQQAAKNPGGQPVGRRFALFY
eukprot:COSAG01_NODE_3309_length_6283_cov_5.946798_6_plen_82_part_00